MKSCRKYNISTEGECEVNYFKHLEKFIIRNFYKNYKKGLTNDPELWYSEYTSKRVYFFARKSPCVRENTRANCVLRIIILQRVIWG